MLEISQRSLPVTDAFTVLELNLSDVALLQRFLEDNPLYFQVYCGRNPAADEAHKLLTEAPPVDWGFSRKFVLAYFDQYGQMMALVEIVSDLLAQSVWHLGWLVVATSHHNKGYGSIIYKSLERWATLNGAMYMRLGVIVGNTCAELLWAKQGFVRTRFRENVAMGALTHRLAVMVKPLASTVPRQAAIDRYLALVPRDAPEKPDKSGLARPQTKP